MKLTDSLQLFIDKEVEKYCKQLQIKTPTILTSIKQVLELPKKITKGKVFSKPKHKLS